MWHYGSDMNLLAPASSFPSQQGEIGEPVTVEVGEDDDPVCPLPAIREACKISSCSPALKNYTAVSESGDDAPHHTLFVAPLFASPRPHSC